MRELTSILNFRNFRGSSVKKKYSITYIIQESRMRENLTYGLKRGHGKQGIIYPCARVLLYSLQMKLHCSEDFIKLQNYFDVNKS